MAFQGKKNIVKVVLTSILLLALVIALLKLNGIRDRSVEGWTQVVEPFEGYKEADLKIKSAFKSNSNSATPFVRYQELFSYFTNGFIEYRSKNGALVHYPGDLSSNGRKINALEGFARYFPLAASWLSGGNPNIVLPNNNEVNLVALLREGILAGTDPNNAEYWGDIQNRDQRIVEAADIALGLWISRDLIWTTLTTVEKERIANWLNQSLNKEIENNNWNLFPITIHKSLESLGYSDKTYDQKIYETYQNYKTQFYLGEGWFNDPPNGVDYYNAWAIHYSLFWLDQIDPELDPLFIRKTHKEFLAFYRFLFSENGFPIMGRSICYRIAAPAPLITGALIIPDEIPPGLAFRTLDLTWSFFVENNSLQQGTVTQGYFEPDMSILDSYSGTGSCQWSLRSLIVAFYVDNYIPLWNSPEVKLPVEIDDFSITNNTIGWRIIGDKFTQTIDLELLHNKDKAQPKLIKYGINNKIKEYIAHRPIRPNNHNALYNGYLYSTAFPVQSSP